MIDFAAARCIVEFGPGTGSFTKELIKRKKRETLLFLIEQNAEFCRQLREQYGKKINVHVIQGSAEHVETFLKKFGLTHADYIVSGLPFTTLPKEVSTKIFISTQQVLGKKGSFITFQYSMVKQKLFKKYFELVGCQRELRNIPPAYVLVMKSEAAKIQESRGLDGGLYSNCG
ncbi:MAG: methyltransferase domain-containing protein [Lachnospiraceae bacterium]|nr:methyltransferase domain-containing protein [Lachnospiraceae bacterium]